MRKKAVRAIVALFVLEGASGAIANAQSVAARTDAAAPGADTVAGNFVANLTFDASHSATGTLVQAVPSIGYSFGKWVVKFGVPFDSVGASSGVTQGGSHRGIGDLFLSGSYSIDMGNLGLASTVLGTAPTGNATTGLGTGQATWNWTNHVDYDFDWITPFIDAGLGNSLNSASGVVLRSGGQASRSSRIITIPTAPYMTIGKVAHVDTGVDFDVSSSVTLGVLAYDTIPWGDQTAISRFVQPMPPVQSSPPAQHNQISRTTRGQRFFELNAITQGTASLTHDNGFGTSVGVSPTRCLDLAISYSRSVSMHLDAVGVTVSTNLTRLFGKSS